MSFTRTSPLIGLALWLGFAAAPASAQPLPPVQPYPGPGVGGIPFNPYSSLPSPYLGLNRNNTGINYLIERDRRANFNALGTGLTQLNQRVAQLNRALAAPRVSEEDAEEPDESVGGVPVSGHETSFLNTGGYFLNSSPRPNAGVGLGQPSRTPGVRGVSSGR